MSDFIKDFGKNLIIIVESAANVLAVFALAALILAATLFVILGLEYLFVSILNLGPLWGTIITIVSILLICTLAYTIDNR